MRLFQYSILACLMICIIADDEDEEAGPDSEERTMQPPTVTGVRERCSFKPDQTNCAGHNFPRRWVYRRATDTCEPISWPTCWSHNGVFRRCRRCMKVCTRHKKGAAWRRRIRQFCRKTARGHWKKHSLN
uniref:Pancreatic trypsin inhibitor n=1 Tax=Rhipicephalus zambeziensis TaxID=60191 RepID=A0A224Y4P5_9ACAR